MAKRLHKPRWERVNNYELTKKHLLGQATPAESAAAEQAIANRRLKGCAEVFTVAGKFVVR